MEAQPTVVFDFLKSLSYFQADSKTYVRPYEAEDMLKELSKFC